MTLLSSNRYSELDGAARRRLGNRKGIGHPAWIWVPLRRSRSVDRGGPECPLNNSEAVPCGVRAGPMRCSDNGTNSARSSCRSPSSPAAVDLDQSDLCGCPSSPRLRRYGD
ncbi:hypothetical protein EAG_11745 [Camponotus floridanus]|uniref:Uncharacterized protein n=1 Tax=Camponotus floridanus TaxID=104421 RepID=E2AYH4_CAMFO|nr:hypothetical protein EAG_11745 [Camponotus floridanus]